MLILMFLLLVMLAAMQIAPATPPPVHESPRMWLYAFCARMAPQPRGYGSRMGRNAKARRKRPERAQPVTNCPIRDDPPVRQQNIANRDDGTSRRRTDAFCLQAGLLSIARRA